MSQQHTDAEQQVDTVTRTVLRHKFDSIADEMESTLLRSAYSSIVKEAQDASAAIFDPQGRTIAQAVAIPAHLGMMVPAVESVLQEFPPAEMSPDDIYMMNDPYDGGTHLPDITVVKPVFNDDKVIALGVTMAHHQEMGGKTPGSIPTDATEIYQEGIRFPPLKYHDRGEVNETARDVLTKNVRIPDVVIGDLNAQISAVTTAERRLAAVVEEYGNDTFITAVKNIMGHAEELTRSKIADIPDGEYDFYDYIDDDGVNIRVPIRIKATVTVDGTDMHVDFTGTDEQADGPVNAVPAATLSAVYYVVRAITDPDIPNNAGCFMPVSVTMPKGTLVNPLPPAPVNARTVTFKRIADVLLGALARAVKDRVSAPGSGQLAALTFGGMEDGEQWIYGEVGAGGSGARPTKDGIDCIETDVTNCMNTTAEATEIEYPIRVHRYDLWEDSGGPGRYRGGLGYRKQFEILVDDVTFTHRRDRHDFQPWGLLGGRPSPRCRTEIHRPNGKTEDIPSKWITSLEKGTIIDVYTTGGGGYGPPVDRSLRDVERDLQEEKISVTTAEEEYIVVVNEGEIDRKATRDRRSQLESGSGDEFRVDRGELPETIEEGRTDD
ncbi:hydantoinase B/oxoprolinase family protein [Halalkalirubrum salinum]|uniref:hydantoinase B/oxoprolinase family protein n=1 Tax=Halalkalirubrum salinum TaxID=2563889 RepID=UPI0010FBBBDF|nr:hydantoinase B/oxoprolinase family protein [Halalkalirubrum salinum]